MWMDEWVLERELSQWDSIGRHKYLYRFFDVKAPCVVLSSSNKPENEVNVEACEALSVPIIRRGGGGGTVVLGPGCVVFTMAFFVRQLYENKKYFSLVNGLWIDCLKSVGLVDLIERGISDIAIGDRKIVGSSVFRKRNLFVYQGSLLVDPNWDLMFQLLRHPSREPDYRRGRSHREFLTSTTEAGCNLSAERISQMCSDYISEQGVKQLGGVLDADWDGVDPQENASIRFLEN